MAFKMKGMKFYGDRTRKEMRQDIKEHRKSLGGDKELSFYEMISSLKSSYLKNRTINSKFVNNVL